MPLTTDIELDRLLPIGGEWVRTETTDTIRLPYDGAPVMEVAQGTPALVERAAQAARQAATVLENWSNFQRAELLDRIALLLRRDHASFASAISQETGKPISEARVEVDRCLQTLLASSIVARELHGEVIPIDGASMGAGRMAMTIRQPVGVIGIITPFNVPLNSRCTSWARHWRAAMRWCTSLPSRRLSAL